MAIDPELAAEMQKRGLPMPAAPTGPSGYAADSGNQPLGDPKPIDPELAAEMQRRGLPVPQTMASRLKGMADATANAAPTAGMMVGGTIGGTAGAAAGGVGAVPGAIAGAGVGGAAGSAYKRVYQYLTGARDPNRDTALGNAGDISKAGLAGMAAETAGQGGMALLKAAAPTLIGGGAKIAASVPENYGGAVGADPGILNRAQPLSVMGKAYDAFERYTGLKSVGSQIESGALKSADTSNTAYFDHAIEVAGKVKSGAPIVDSATGKIVKAAAPMYDGAPVTTQDLYSASQKASNLNFGPFENPGAQKAVKAGVLDRAKETVDTALQGVYPEYQGLRQGYFESNARDAFSNVLPQNKNFSTNVLRPSLALGAVAAGAANPASLLALSPAAWGGAIRAGAALSPAAKFLAKYGAAKTAQDAAEGQ